MRSDSPPQRLSDRMVAVVYGAMLALAAALAVAFDVEPALASAPAPWRGLSPWLTGPAVGLGLVVGGAIVERRLAAMRELAELLAAAVGPVGWGRAFGWALASGVAEEALFRGVVQPWIGLGPTTLLFGVLHGGGARRLWPWTAFALVAGLAFGLLAEAHRSAVPAAVAHVVVNAINLRRLGRRASAAEPT